MRIHLFEIEDQQWCPKLFRDYLTDFLRQFESMTNVYKDALPIIEKGLKLASGNRVIDLCSGGSGPWLRLSKGLPNVEVLLTDLYPNKDAIDAISDLANSSVQYHPESVDATSVDKSLSGLKTLFGSFHHFKPEQAKQILLNAVESNEPIAVFEFTERKFSNLFIQPIGVTLSVLMLTPFIKPFRLSRMFFTYIIPVIPLMLIWDGYISNLRTYSPKDLKAMTDSLGVDNYEWEYGIKKTKHPFIGITYLLGYPKVSVNTSKSIQKDQALAAEMYEG